MNRGTDIQTVSLPAYRRDLFGGPESATMIGTGSIGGKASGLVRMESALVSEPELREFPGITVTIPRFTVIGTDYFDEFIRLNRLDEINPEELRDERIAHYFNRAELPVSLLGDLRSLVSTINTPLAVRSSSLLEDAKARPFAGIYGTKMIPNNQPDPDYRFLRLVDAVKFVYASAFFKPARDYLRATGYTINEEKMAVIIQEIMGRSHNRRFYPDISGVARSFNYYPAGRAKPEDGVVDLALGLGRAIVGGGLVWSYSPSLPRVKPFVNRARDYLKQTQSSFWAVNMGTLPAYDPMKETEYLVINDLETANYDGTLHDVASTYDIHSDRINIGLDSSGPPIVDFAPILDIEEIKLNKLLKKVLPVCEKASGSEVEIEFAVNLHEPTKRHARFGLLQVRPMVVSRNPVEITLEELQGDNIVAVSDRTLGNGNLTDIQDIVLVKRDTFNAMRTREIALEIESINNRLVQDNARYLLIGYGRWGSSDHFLGIPVTWGQISGARVIVESMLPNLPVELSQGSHFFHNLSSFQVMYFSLGHADIGNVDWDWLQSLTPAFETEFVRHIRLPSQLTVKVDGRAGRGIITR